MCIMAIVLGRKRVRRPLLADWLKRDAMPVRLRPRARLLASAQRMPRAECCRVKVKVGIVVIDVKILTIKITPQRMNI